MKGERKVKIKLIVLDFRRADFGFKNLFERVTWDKELKEIWA